MRPHSGRRHPGHRAVQDVRGAEGGSEQPAHPVGLPPLLHAHGAPPARLKRANECGHVGSSRGGERRRRQWGEPPSLTPTRDC
eukprot:1160654-Prorocentrum_minimum.AAC.1